MKCQNLNCSTYGSCVNCGVQIYDSTVLGKSGSHVAATMRMAEINKELNSKREFRELKLINRLECGKESTDV